MPYELKSRGDDACVLIERTSSSTAEFPLPFSVGSVIDIIHDLLMLGDTDKSPEVVRNLPHGTLRAERMREAVRLHYGSGSFAIKWFLIHPMIANAE